MSIMDEIILDVVTLDEIKVCCFLLCVCFLLRVLY